MRKFEDYPDYAGYVDYINQHGLDAEIVNKIIKKHSANRERTKQLYERYKCFEDALPIYARKPRFEDAVKPINNKVNNDFFGEINDIMIGYFSGKAASYSYAKDADAAIDTGGGAAREEAGKALSDFILRNNFYDLNQELTKFASVCGYAGRLLYVDTAGEISCMIVPPFECIAVAKGALASPDYAIRYYAYEDIEGKEVWKAEVYDQRMIYYYGGEFGSLTLESQSPHLFGFCPLQIVPLNGEMLGSAERVMALIDEYDKTVSDNANDAEGNTQAQQIFDGIDISDEEMEKARKSGSIRIPPGYQGTSHSVYYLTKDINDGFNEHHLDRLERNIYRFSKTPNLNDESFGSASGISLKFKLTAFEAKCGAFEAKLSGADTYMFKVLGTAFSKKGIAFDYLQCYAEYKRNFPADIASEAQSVQALINAGVPEEIAYNQLSSVDDIEYVLALKEQKKQDALDMFGGTGDQIEDDEETDEVEDEDDKRAANES